MVALTALVLAASLTQLRAEFKAPPPAAELQAWWHWLDDEYTAETCRRDIDAMQAFGIRTAYIFAPGAYYPIDRLWKPMLSKPWLANFDLALKRAKEHGMTLGFHNCPGWSSTGGPWIDLEHSMKVVVANEMDLVGDETDVTIAPSAAVYKGFHRDIALLAIKVPDDPQPAAVSRAFPTVLKIAQPGSADIIQFEYAQPVPALTTMLIEWIDTTHHSTVTVEGSTDGALWQPLAHAHLKYYHATPTPKTVGFDRPPAAGTRFLRVTFRYVDAPAHIAHFDVRVKSIRFSSVRLIANLDAKNGASGHGLAYCPPPLGQEREQGLDLSQVRDLSAFMAADGRVDLAAAKLPRCEAGKRWRLLRIGYTSTGKTCSPATLAGLEVDKLDRSGIEAHWPHMPARFLSRPQAKDVLKFCVIDSYEAGGQNWTVDMFGKFRKLRGYDLKPYLPVLLGYVTGTTEESEKFLYDFQRTISDLFMTEYFGRFRELCHENGLTAVIEGYDGPYDPLEACLQADIPCGEFWLGGTGASNARVDKTPTWVASAAHIKGVGRVAAESFTTGAKEGRWQVTPAELRVEGDRAWLYGISQLVYHSYVSQPFENLKPGLSLAAHGTHLNRNTTWWPEGRCWSAYVARGQSLLQGGRNHAEVLVLSGEGNAYSCLEPPKGVVESGCNFDWVPAKKLKDLVVTDGKVGFPGLPPYEVLDLGCDRYLTEPTLQTVYQLILKGARVRGLRPWDSPMLNDFMESWHALANAIWDGGILDQGKVRPFADSKGALKSRRRDFDDAVVYFLLNDRDVDFDGAVSLVSPKGAKAEVWTAEDGAMTPVAVRVDGENRVSVKLSLKAHRSVFVVLSPACGEPASSSRGEVRSVAGTVDSWMVTFDGPGAVAGVQAFDRLRSWSEHDNPAIRYFSGRARYVGNFIQPYSPVFRASRIALDLGRVCDLARVWVNQRPVGILWQEPFTADITEYVREGVNQLEIEVVNTWPNRMIGDARMRRDFPQAEKKAPLDTWFPPDAYKVFSRPVECFPDWVVADRPDSGTGIYTWSNYDFAWGADEPLKPAGLLGPVRILRTDFDDR